MFTPINESRICTTCNERYVAKSIWQRFCSDRCRVNDPVNKLKEKYSSQKISAFHRGIPFLLTFDEWLKEWQDSGHLHERGKSKGRYVMARFGDSGPYAVGNIKIIKAEENNSEKVLTDKNIASIKVRNKGNSYGLGYKHTAEASIKMKQKAQARDNAHFRGKKHSESSKAKISQSLRLRQKSTIKRASHLLARP